jgi:hypothetical protein
VFAVTTGSPGFVVALRAITGSDINGAKVELTVGTIVIVFIALFVDIVLPDTVSSAVTKYVPGFS